MKRLKLFVVSLAVAMAAPQAWADIITDWNEKAVAIVGKAGPGAPGHRMMAIVQVSVYEAVNAITQRYPVYGEKLSAPAGASIEAAVAAANRRALLDVVPAESAAIEAAYQSAVAAVPEGQAKIDGIAVGERAASGICARGAKDGFNAADTYQPHTTAGVYVPTMLPVSTAWPKRTAWMLTSGSQFRPGPPPKLDSETWTRDFNEIKALGGKSGSKRTPEQTTIAQFWEETRPVVYHPIVRQVASMPGRTVPQNARLLAAATMAADDALIAVFDAKYAYNFWRPVTAIRNAQLTGNSATAAEPGWVPFINTPMHPNIPARTASCPARSARCCSASSARRRRPSSPRRALPRRAWCASGRAWPTSCRKCRSRESMTACTTATPPSSATSSGRRSATT
jgi:hypothetical protein